MNSRRLPWRTSQIRCPRSEGSGWQTCPSRRSWSAFFLLSLWELLVLASGEIAPAQTQINVTNFGLRGDAVVTTASTVSNSAIVTAASTNTLSAADAGKIIQLFGAGPNTSGPNYQDLVAQITSVLNSNTVQISVAAGRGLTNVRCIYGTQNALALQQCINSCTGSNTTIYFPAGIYLMMPPASLDPNFVMTGETDGQPAVMINKGGLHLLGAGSGTTILLGNGAWQLKGSPGFNVVFCFIVRGR